MVVQEPAKPVREHVSTTLLKYLCAMANRGALRPGDRLPAERDLAHNLRISRPSLREGIGHLATFGVLRSVHGVGTFVVKDLRYGPLGDFCELNNFPAWKMFEARLAIEPHVAALAAGRATKEQIDQLAQEVASMRAAVDTPDLHQAHDIRFHQMVAHASGNPVLTALVEAITTSSVSGNALCQASGPPSDFAESAELHRKIYRAIRSRNPGEARLAMQRSLELSRAAITAQVPAGSAAIAALAEREDVSIERISPVLQPPLQAAVRPFAPWSRVSSPVSELRGAATDTG